MIEIDGSYLEGGGQILRSAASLATITQQPCRIFNIRAGRSKPGLAYQHLLGLRALNQLCGGRLQGDELGSLEISFWPADNFKKKVFINIPTAGSITLALQGLLLPALSSGQLTEISFKGGATDTFFSPTIDHFRFVFLEIIKKMFTSKQNEVFGSGETTINIEIKKRGFYPEGGAEVETQILAETSPLSKLKPVFLTEPGRLKRILIISGASQNLEKNKVAERQISGAKQILAKLKLPLEEKIEYYQIAGSGSQINIIGQLENTTLGVDNLGKLGKSAEIIGQEAALDFLQQARTNACLDKHLADQILPLMALANGQSQVNVAEITKHCQTNIWVIEKFLGDKGKFEIKNNLISWLPK